MNLPLRRPAWEEVAVRMWADGAGNIIARSAPGPYGEELGYFPGARTSMLGFAGYLGDKGGSGLWHTPNRSLTNQGRFLSVDPSGTLNLHDPRTFNQYAYVGGNPITYTDPLGLRWVDVYIWKAKAPYVVGSGSVGHVMITEHNSDKRILSVFPREKSLRESERNLTFSQTMEREGRPPDQIFDVFVPKDEAFDKMVKEQIGKGVWDWNPSAPNETHCSRAAYDALKAGGVPMSEQDSGQILPGTFGDLLQGLTTQHTSKDKWDVRPKEFIGPQKPTELPKSNYYLWGGH
ncbi:MAG TPA: RHS repeat-associated core domain-containing protein [Acidobacteriota bacterium]|nr:RHS repeat-associated core domain-containing protein [Acidobacteriota bacterium]HNT16889.1 RHS repeat-associated core domain-containing protein [Acidobacteriota bacterium]